MGEHSGGRDSYLPHIVSSFSVFRESSVMSTINSERAQGFMVIKRFLRAIAQVSAADSAIWQFRPFKKFPISPIHREFRT